MKKETRGRRSNVVGAISKFRFEGGNRAWRDSAKKEFRQVMTEWTEEAPAPHQSYIPYPIKSAVDGYLHTFVFRVPR